MKKTKEKGRTSAQSGKTGLLADDHDSCYQISTVIVNKYFRTNRSSLEMIEGKGDGRREVGAEVPTQLGKRRRLAKR